MPPTGEQQDGTAIATSSSSPAGGGEGLAWLSVWDTSVDAAEFFDLMDTAILKRFGT